MVSTAGHGLAPGAKLLHIGPFKTGTTVVQGAFHAARERLAEHDVRYAGEQRQALRAALAVLGRPAPAGWAPPLLSEWQALVDEVTSGAARRVVVSSEFFSDADEDATGRIVTDLGGPLVNVVVTLRPLARIAPSHWQYAVQTGMRMPYETWLDRTLTEPLRDRGPGSFWRRQRHDRLVERWAHVVGADRLTVVVVDDSDPTMLLRTFESLTGLPAGFLRPEPDGDSNRSLTHGEIEIVRSLNLELERLGLRETATGRSIRRGVVRQMRAGRPQPVDRRFPTPEWALERCAEIGGQMAAGIAGSGVHVIGDLAALGKAAPVRAEVRHAAPVETEPGVANGSISVELALQAVLGAVHGAKPELGGLPDPYARPPAQVSAAPGAAPASRPALPAGEPARPPGPSVPGAAASGSFAAGRRSVEHERVADVPGRRLLSVLAGRVRRRIRRAAGRGRAPLSSGEPAP